MYLYNDFIFNDKESARDMVKAVVSEKHEKSSIGEAINDSGLKLPKNPNIFVGMRTLYRERNCCRVEGVFSNLILSELPLFQNNSFVDIYENNDIVGSKYELSREMIVFTIRCLFKNKYQQYNNCSSIPNILFRALNYPIKMSLKPMRTFYIEDDIRYYTEYTEIGFDCILPVREVCYKVSLNFNINFENSYIEYRGDTLGYASSTIPELNISYKRTILREDLCAWIKYMKEFGHNVINKNTMTAYHGYSWYSVEDYPKFFIKEGKKYLIFSGENYFKSLLKKEETNIHFIEDRVISTSSSVYMDCFKSINGIDYVYTGAKSKHADVHIEKGETFKSGRYYVYKDKMGFFAIGKQRVFYGSIKHIKNINGEVVLYGLRFTSSDELHSNRNEYYNCMTESLSVLQSVISDLDGKTYGEHNYTRDMIKNSKYYRYAELIGIRDCKFSTLFKFENAVYAYIRYNGSIRLIYSKVKSIQEKKQLVQNMKKIISIPSFRKFCIKRVYSFNIFETKSRISAGLNLNKKYVGNYTDFDELIKISNREKDIVFSVSCINKQNNEIESTFILENGNVTYIDGVKIDI